jgi:hypothetical protein
MKINALHMKASDSCKIRVKNKLGVDSHPVFENI